MENKPSAKPYIIIGIISLIIVGAVIWYFSGQTPRITPKTGVPISGEGISFPTGATTQTGQGEERGMAETGLMGAPEAKLLQITDFAVVSPTLNKAGNKLLFYAKAGGDIYESDFLGKEKKKISNITILGILEAQWSPLKDKALVWYLDGGEIKKFIQNISTTTQAAFLPQAAYTASWSPDGSSMAYILPNKNEFDLVISDSSARNPKIRFKTPINDFQIFWTGQNQLSFNSASSGFAPSILYVFNLKGGSFSKIIDNIYGFVPLWSPDGKQLLYSATNNNGKGLSLYLKKADGKTLKLKVATLPEKCVWSSDSKEIFCASPRALNTGPMPDEYYQGLTDFSDKFIKIDSETNEITELYNELEFDAQNPIVTSDKQRLFFINRKDETLWGINLATSH